MLQRSSRTALGIAAALTAAACVASLAPAVTQASSHREAPLVAGEPQLDNTDVYAFVSPDAPNTVTMLANWVPFEEPNGGPNFYPFASDAAYDINIDNDGDARADLIYRWTFTDNYRSKNTFLYNTGVVTTLDDPDLNYRQTYKLEAITESGSTTLINNGRVAPSRVGNASMPNYASLANAAITPLPGGGQTFAGQADDPFFLDLRIFDLLYGGDFSEVGQDTVGGYNANTLAIQVPKSVLALGGDATRNPVVGVWSTTSRQRIEVVDTLNNRNRYGGWQQVSRLGMPLVNEVVIPVGRKDEFNATAPRNDGKFAQFVTNPEVPRLVEAIYKIPAPATPRQDLVEVFLTGLCKACGPVAVDLNSQRLNRDVDPATFVPSEQLRLNMSVPPSATPNRLGVLGGDNAGFPNGRRLADDVTDVTLRVAEGVLLPNHPAAVDGLGDAVDTNARAFRGTFPYVALPNVIAVNQN
ncbi:DUF4331 domain-containing protein [Actinoplanes sp. NPDC023936]|uniref:DUF4331 domain-containing protein n=1 Tax=Actinoplanes sp. NPDC023936 TaxID=3154910 RepID=UPI0033F8AF2E